jgi:NitT/TauT family transport system permease protein
LRRLNFEIPVPLTRVFSGGDALILLALAALLYGGARLALGAPQVIAGPEISLSVAAVPWYALLSIARMSVAYGLSLTFSLVYGYAAARHASARALMMPLLDVLQSVPILSFLPVVLLGLSAFLPRGFAAELTAVVLIFTSQAWNMTFSFYQSVRTIPVELREAAAMFRLSPWLRLRHLELPFAAVGLIWNSVMSWAGGWFFLMAAEMFHVGDRDFRLPGLGSYLQTAASRGDLRAVLIGVATLVVVVAALDQLVWRPLLAWAERFKLETVEGDPPPGSWFRDVLSQSWIARQCADRIGEPLLEQLDGRLGEPPAGASRLDLQAGEGEGAHRSVMLRVVAGLVIAAAVYGGYRAAVLLATLDRTAWIQVGEGLLATLLRVAVALGVALLWAVPVGAMIGMNRRLTAALQPVVQILAAIPATALFPVLLLLLLRVPGGLNLAAVILMLLGTQWYLLFNVIAGASAIPQDLIQTTDLLRLGKVERWRRLILPGLFPYIVTGGIAASGGAWNASIVAEYVQFGGSTHATIGLGAAIADATASGKPALLLAATLVMVGAVVLINRLFWRRLYRLAEARYCMD